MKEGFYLFTFFLFMIAVVIIVVLTTIQYVTTSIKNTPTPTTTPTPTLTGTSTPTPSNMYSTLVNTSIDTSLPPAVQQEDAAIIANQQQFVNTFFPTGVFDENQLTTNNSSGPVNTIPIPIDPQKPNSTQIPTQLVAGLPNMNSVIPPQPGIAQNISDFFKMNPLLTPTDNSNIIDYTGADAATRKRFSDPLDTNQYTVAFGIDAKTKTISNLYVT